MKRFLLVPLVILMVGALIFGGCAEKAPAPAQPAAEPIELAFTTQCHGPGEAHYASLKYFADEVEKRTDGRVKVTLYLSATLVSVEESYEGIVKGVADIGEVMFGFIKGPWVISEACLLPVGYPSSFAMNKAMQDFGEKYAAEEWDVVRLYWSTPPPCVVATRDRPVRKAEDMKGLIIRASGAPGADLLTQLGAVPRVVPAPEVYESLSKAVLDGVFMSAEAAPAWRIHEVCNYATDAYCVSTAIGTCDAMNKDSFNRLSPQDQKIILEVSSEMPAILDRDWSVGYDEGVALFKTEGREWIELPPDELAKFKAAGQATIDKWVEEMKAKGYPAAAEYVKYLQERIDYWEKQR